MARSDLLTEAAKIFFKGLLIFSGDTRQGNIMNPPSLFHLQPDPAVGDKKAYPKSDNHRDTSAPDQLLSRFPGYLKPGVSIIFFL